VVLSIGTTCSLAIRVVRPGGGAGPWLAVAAEACIEKAAAGLCLRGAGGGAHQGRWEKLRADFSGEADSRLGNQSVLVHIRYYREKKLDKCR
jgi:hypothetical protein